MTTDGILRGNEAGTRLALPPGTTSNCDNDDNDDDSGGTNGERARE
jgi:hypothetical protein